MDNETREYTLEEIYNNLNDYVTAEEAKGKDMMFQRVALNVFKLKLNEGMQKVGRWIEYCGDLHCSVCGFRNSDHYCLGKGIACPNCGAFMPDGLKNVLG